MLVKSQVKYIQSLSQKQFRDEAGVFVAEGPKIINELLAAKLVPLQLLYATQNWLSANAHLLSAADASVTQHVTAKDLERISFLTTPNEVLGVFKKPAFSADSLLSSGLSSGLVSGVDSGFPSGLDSGLSSQMDSGLSSRLDSGLPSGPGSGLSSRMDSGLSSGLNSPPASVLPSGLASDSLILMLDHIQDPGNLGTIIRCADWFGIKQIICSNDSADNFNPKVVQSTMASVVRVAVHYTDLVSFLRARPGLSVFAAALDGKPLDQFRGSQTGVLVIGNESKGISEDVMALATDRITIPRRGQAESLNAAVATGIILSHMIR